MTEHKPIVGSASHCSCAEYDGYYSKYCPIHGHMPDMVRIVDEMNRLAEGLKWIAQQPCTMDCEEASEDTECIETSACCTEWCLSCYAKGVLKGMPVRLNVEASKLIDHPCFGGDYPEGVRPCLNKMWDDRCTHLQAGGTWETCTSGGKSKYLSMYREKP